MDHHVYFWLKEECNGAVDRAVFEQGLTSLLEIDEIGRGRWSVPAAVLLRPVHDQTWDYALALTFASVADHDVYQDHPQHHVFVNAFKGWWAKVQVMDLA